MQRIVFIINPISGTHGAKADFPEKVRQHLDLRRWAPEYVYTERPGHGKELASAYAAKGYDAVVSVGGDGTLNEVADGVRDTETALGIIPLGSGNGFARHIGIPMSTEAAIELLNTAEVRPCDYGLANEQFFISTCGTGFDATVADDFARSGSRGFMTYLKYSVIDAFRFRPEKISFSAEDPHQELPTARRAYMVNFANAGQWGYGAAIAPHAKVDDGLLDITIMSRWAPFGLLDICARMFLGGMKHSPWITALTATDIVLHRQSKGRQGCIPFHIDGTPVDMPDDVHIRLVADGLKILR